jgi:hypothetical protein
MHSRTSSSSKFVTSSSHITTYSIITYAHLQIHLTNSQLYLQNQFTQDLQQDWRTQFTTIEASSISKKIAKTKNSLRSAPDAPPPGALPATTRANAGGPVRLRHGGPTLVVLRAFRAALRRPA